MTSIKFSFKLFVVHSLSALPESPILMRQLQCCIKRPCHRTYWSGSRIAAKRLDTTKNWPPTDPKIRWSRFSSSLAPPCRERGIISLKSLAMPVHDNICWSNDRPSLVVRPLKWWWNRITMPSTATKPGRWWRLRLLLKSPVCGQRLRLERRQGKSCK